MSETKPPQPPAPKDADGFWAQLLGVFAATFVATLIGILIAALIGAAIGALV